MRILKLVVVTRADTMAPRNWRRRIHRNLKVIPSAKCILDHFGLHEKTRKENERKNNFQCSVKHRAYTPFLFVDIEYVRCVLYWYCVFEHTFVNYMHVCWEYSEFSLSLFLLWCLQIWPDCLKDELGVGGSACWLLLWCMKWVLRLSG